jgi:magnesium transporter
MSKRSAKRKSSIKKQPGLPPGTVFYAGNSEVKHEIDFQLFAYNQESVNWISTNKFSEIENNLKDENLVYWLNITGVHNVNAIEKVGEYFKISNLVLEDIANTFQRPKIDNYNDFNFLHLKMPVFTEAEPLTYPLNFEQLSLGFNQNIIITFQETPADWFQPIRDRISNNIGLVRQHRADFLAYRLLDVISDQYMVLADFIDEEIEAVEEDLMDTNDFSITEKIRKLRKATASLRVKVLGFADISATLINGSLPFILKENKPFLLDLRDHSLLTLDRIERMRENLVFLSEEFQNKINQHTNSVVKLLTIISTIFIPLTFIVGIYGMNFENMPELAWRFAYPAILAIMLMLSVGMLIYFKKKKWL